MKLTNNAEGGTNGTTVSTANSGGDSGNAWNAVVGTPTITYDNTHTYGKFGYKIVGAASAQQVSWTTSMGTVTNTWGRLYLWSSSAPSAATGLIRWTSGAGQAARIRVESTGVLTFADAGNAAEFSTTTAVATLSAFCRIEWRVIFATTNATAEIKVFTSPESTTAAETVSSTTIGGLTASADGIQFGSFNSCTWTGWIDDVEVNDTGYPGPALRPRPYSKLSPMRQAIQRSAFW